MNAPNSSTGVFQFHYKGVADHLLGILKYWKAWILSALAVFGTLWMLMGVATYFLDKEYRGMVLLIILILISFALATTGVIYRYISAIPIGLESESRLARKLGHIQRHKWEFRLAQTLLKEKLSLIDKELEDLLSNRIHISAKRTGDRQAYIDWLIARPDNLERMLNVLLHLIITDLMEALHADQEKSPSPAEIVDVTNKIRALYADTVAFEREGHAVIPPDDLEKVHKLQLGWSAPIRDGVHQMFDFFDKVIAMDPKQHSALNFTINFESPPNIEEYCAELDRLQGRL